MHEPPPLKMVIKKLSKFYGQPKRPPVSDPFELVLWENAAYLLDDEKRATAFATLKKNIGLKPKQILNASQPDLVAVGKLGGMLPEVRAQRLRQIAEIGHWIFKDDLNSALKKSLRDAKKALKRFPAIGDPGAEKILMFSRTYPVLGLESNGLRVLVRLGFSPEKKSYSATYRGVQEAIKEQLSKDYNFLIATHQHLRRHGQELCKRSQPLCADCPLKTHCAYFQGSLPPMAGA